MARGFWGFAAKRNGACVEAVSSSRKGGNPVEVSRSGKPIGNASVCAESTQNPHKIHTKSTQNPHNIHTRSTQNPHKIHTILQPLQPVNCAFRAGRKFAAVSTCQTRSSRSPRQSALGFLLRARMSESDDDIVSVQVSVRASVSQEPNKRCKRSPGLPRLSPDGELTPVVPATVRPRPGDELAPVWDWETPAAARLPPPPFRKVPAGPQGAQEAWYTARFERCVPDSELLESLNVAHLDCQDRTVKMYE